MNEKLKKGTTTIGIVCKDGIVLAADKRATAGFVVNKRAQKIFKIADEMAITMAGLVSDAQLLTKLIKAELTLKDIQTKRKSTVKEAANLLGDMLYSNIRRPSMIQSIVGFLLAGHDKDGLHLYDLGIDGSITEVQDYISDGSGSLFALGVLEANFKKNVPVNEGVKLAIKAITAALQRDTATGNGVDVWTITKEGISPVFHKEIEIKVE